MEKRVFRGPYFAIFTDIQTKPEQWVEEKLITEMIAWARKKMGETVDILQAGHKQDGLRGAYGRD